MANESLISDGKARGIRIEDGVSGGLVSAAALVEHARAHRHCAVNVVVDAHFLFRVVQAVQASDVLRERAAPRDRQREEERVEPAVVEALADIAARGDDHAWHVFGNFGDLTRGECAELVRLAAFQQHDMRDLSAQRIGERVRVRGALGEHKRRAPLGDGGEDVADDLRVSASVGGELRVEILDARRLGRRRNPERGRTWHDDMIERPRRRLPPSIHAEADWAALHEDDRMMPVLPHRRRREAEDVARFHLPHHRLEAERGKMMAFIHDDVAVVGDEIAHGIFADHALEDCDIASPLRQEYVASVMNEYPKNYLLVRSSRAIPFEENVVGIGWDYQNFCDYPNGNTLVNALNAQGDGIGRCGNQIRRFKSINAGDVIVVPYWGTLAVGVATGEALYDKRYYGKNGGNQQRVAFPRDPNGKARLIPRADVSGGLQARLKIRITVANLWEFQPELDALLAKLQAGKAYSWSEEVAEKEGGMENEVKRQLLENIRAGKTGLKSGGIGLEQLVCELLRADGFSADILGKTVFPEQSDADIKASKSNALRDDEFLIQVKHHSGVTGMWGQEQLNEIKRLMPEEYGGFHLVLVTSGDVEGKAKESADASGITILDGKDLVDWIFDSLKNLSANTKRKLGVSEVPRIIS